MEHFMHPRNKGEIKNPDAMATVGNQFAEDSMKIYIKVGKNKNKKEFIKDIKFETLGCGAAIAIFIVWLPGTGKRKDFRRSGKKLLYKNAEETGRIATD